MCCLRCCVFALGTSVILLLTAGAGPARAQIFSSTSSSGDGVDCGGLELTGAKGVPGGDLHWYRLEGVCRLLRLSSSTSKVAGVPTGTDHSSTQVGTVWALTEIRWDRGTGEMKQSLKVEGDRNGRLELILKCAQDPVLGKVLCHKVAYDNGTGWGGFDAAWARGQPITNGRVTEAEAAALSKQASGTKPPPPPPPPPPAPAEAAPRARTDRAATSTVAVAKQPPVLPARPGFTEIPLAQGARKPLENGRTVASVEEAGELRWAILGEDGEVLRRFPSGSRVFENAQREIVVDWGGGTYRAGRARAGRLQLPRSP